MKIYNNFQEYLNDAPQIERKTKQLDNDIDLLTNMAFNSDDESVPF